MLQIVVPMAGMGSRFARAGYELPKPLIPVSGVPMIQLVVSNLRPSVPHRFIFITQKAHQEKYGVDKILRQVSPDCEVITVHGVTQGAACTVLLASEFINTADPLMIANSDQWVDVDINNYLAEFERKPIDGLIMTMTANDPKWSYVKLDAANRITEVIEKKVVSNEATVGIYNYRHGRDFVRAAESMIERNLRVNNEFYVAPAYNQLIEEGQVLSYFNIGSEGNGMYGIGIPEDLEAFLKNPVCQKAMLPFGAGRQGEAV